jgi:hypothetical protein
MIWSGRVLPKMAVHLPLQGLDLLAQHPQDRGGGLHGGGVGGHDNLRLAQVVGA